MDAAALYELVVALCVVSIASCFAGGMLWGAIASFAAWFNSRPVKPMTPAQLVNYAKALRSRAAALERRAEKRRFESLPHG